MTQGHKIAAVLMGVVIQGAPAEFCAKGAGIGLPAYVEYHFTYVGFEYFKGNAY